MNEKAVFFSNLFFFPAIWDRMKMVVRIPKLEIFPKKKKVLIFKFSWFVLKKKRSYFFLQPLRKSGLFFFPLHEKKNKILDFERMNGKWSFPVKKKTVPFDYRIKKREKLYWAQRYLFFYLKRSLAIHSFKIQNLVFFFSRSGKKKQTGFSQWL